MRTTVDLPDDLYRGLKARAAFGGITVKELVCRLLEQGLRSPAVSPLVTAEREPPPVIIQPRGIPIAAVSRTELLRLEEEDDEARSA